MIESLVRPTLVVIDANQSEGVTPLCLIAGLGTISSTAIDPIEAIGELCAERGIWLHVDAAYAGTVLLLPEFRWMLGSAQNVDSFVVNPHKWMATNFDCTAYYVRDVGAQERPFDIQPECLKTRADTEVRTHRDWGIQLGRRFRALKLWIVLSSFGLEGLQRMPLRQLSAGSGWRPQSTPIWPLSDRRRRCSTAYVSDGCRRAWTTRKESKRPTRPCCRNPRGL